MTVAEKVAAANARVIEIMTKGRPVWTDVRPALEAVPGMELNLILVPGPPIEPKDLPIPLKTAVCGAACHDGMPRLAPAPAPRPAPALAPPGSPGLAPLAPARVLLPSGRAGHKGGGYAP